MKAVVLAGGLGTRLHPLTVNLPKPMVPIGNQPMMEYVIYLLRKHKFKDITVLLYHRPEVIKNYFGDGSKFGVEISYIEAQEDYGTAGAVRYAAENFKEPFLVISADLVTDFNLEEIVKYHKAKQALATLVLTRVPNPLPYGIVILNSDGRIRHFLEKPSWSEVFSDTINCGIYVLDPKALEYIPSGRPFDFSHDLFPLLLADSLPLYGFVAAGLWKDIGNLIEYGKVQRDLFPDGIIGENSLVADSALFEKTIIGRNCQIGRGARLRQTILWDNVVIGSEARLESATVARGTVIGDRSYLEEGVVVGEECNIGKDVNIKPFVKIWPNKVIEEGATVSRSMVWRERWSRGIFGPYGVTGLCNVEVTPEFAAALGAAYGTLLGAGSNVVASRDSHKASRMIYRALISGILSAGVNISNLEEVPIPINRFEVRSLKSRGGFHVRKSPYDPEVIDIKFFDDDGKDLKSIKEKKVERFFFGEDFVRVGIERIGELTFPYHRVAESYKNEVLAKIDKEAIRAANFKIAVDYAYSSAALIFPALLGELGIEVIALNAHIDESKITKTKSMFEHGLAQLSQIVKSLEADLGIMLDTGAEKIFLCDEKGNILQGDKELAVLSGLVCRSVKNAQIAVPVKASRVVETVVKECGGRLVRTKTSARDMMAAADRREISFLGENLGGFIFPEFQPAFDAMFATIKLLEMLAKQRVKLSQLGEEVPPIKMVCREISCAPEQKGLVLRTIVDELKDEAVDMTDGIKIFQKDDWTLILPDPLRPVIHVCAEADSEKAAQKLTKTYIDKIDSIL